jgi:intracellular sulfur oxidation DsrE/DsrF family protein
MKTLPFLVSSLALMAASGTMAAAADGVDRRSESGQGYARTSTIKLVIDLNTSSPGGAGANPGLIAVENLVEQYGARRPRPPKVDVVVVLHAKNADLALDEAAVRRRGGSISNPDRARMKALSVRGIRFVVSLQSLASQGIREEEVLSWVGRGQNASMIFLDLEAAGYIFDSAKSLGQD